MNHHADRGGASSKRDFLPIPQNHPQRRSPDGVHECMHQPSVVVVNSATCDCLAVTFREREVKGVQLWDIHSYNPCVWNTDGDDLVISVRNVHLHLLYVFCLEPFWTLDNIEGDLVTFGKGFETVAYDR